MGLYGHLEGLWTSICVRYKPGQIEVVGLMAGQVVGFILPATLYLLVDLVFPEFSRRHKIQSMKRQPTWPQIQHCIKISLFNILWLTVVHFVVMYLTDFNHATFIIDPRLPSLRTVAVDFVLGLMAREIMFYYVHRALHHPRIYPYIYKMHHKYTAPVSFSAEYAHPFEHLIANVLPISLPLAAKGTHFLSFLCFAVFELWEAAADHSGYDFLKLPPAEIHDLHHASFRVNYGTLGIMDWVHGTDVVGWDKPKARKVKIAG